MFVKNRIFLWSEFYCWGKNAPDNHAWRKAELGELSSAVIVSVKEKFSDDVLSSLDFNLLKWLLAKESRDALMGMLNVLCHFGHFNIMYEIQQVFLRHLAVENARLT